MCNISTQICATDAQKKKSRYDLLKKHIVAPAAPRTSTHCTTADVTPREKAPTQNTATKTKQPKTKREIKGRRLLLRRAISFHHVPCILHYPEQPKKIQRALSTTLR